MNGNKAPGWAKAAFIVYAAVMAWLLFGQRIGYPRIGYSEFFAKNINPVPFATVTRFAAVLNHSKSRHAVMHAFVNLAGNVVMFIPLGMLLPILWRRWRKGWKCMLLCAAVIISIELIQLFAMLGTCDIDDLILNLLGAAIGYSMFALVMRRYKK